MERIKWVVRKAPEWRIPDWGVIAYLIINGLWREGKAAWWQGPRWTPSSQEIP